MIERFIADVQKMHEATRKLAEDMRFQIKLLPPGAFEWDDRNRKLAYYHGELAGIEATAELILGREKMEEVLGIDPEYGSLVLA